MSNKYILTDESGTLSISQGEAMVYDDLSFMTKVVAEKAVRLLNEGKGEESWDELFDCLIAEGCVESGSGCMSAPEDNQDSLDDFLLNVLAAGAK
jgi:hypothetical protein